MVKYNVNYKGREYPVREVDISKYLDGYGVVRIGCYELNKAMQEDTHGWEVADTEASELDNTIYCYMDSGVIEKDLSDEEIIRRIAQMESGMKEYVIYLRKMIAQEQEALGRCSNERVKASIQRRLNSFSKDIREIKENIVSRGETLENDIEKYLSGLLEGLPSPSGIDIYTDDGVYIDSVYKKDGHVYVKLNYTGSTSTEDLADVRMEWKLLIVKHYATPRGSQ